MEKEIISELERIIKKRKKSSNNNSYVLKLFKKGKVKIANKLGEEAVETISAFLSEGKKELLEESADLLFHLLIMLEAANVSLDDVLRVLKSRMKMIDIKNYDENNVFAKILRNEILLQKFLKMNIL